MSLFSQITFPTPSLPLAHNTCRMHASHSTQNSFFRSTNKQSYTGPPLTSARELSTPDRNRQLIGCSLRRAQLQAQARQRYQRILQLQQRSFIERQQLDREREEQVRAEHQKVQLRARQARHQFERFGQSTREWHFRNRCEGAELRMQRLMNQSFCLQRDHADLERKRHKATPRRSSLLPNSKPMLPLCI